jgi:hypothetical protein
MDTQEPLEPESADGAIVKVSVEILETGQGPYELKLERETPLAEVLERGLTESGNQLVPEPQPPLDKLHNLRHKEVGPAIANLEEPLWKYLREPHTTHDFGIELVRAFRVNTRWAVALEPQMTPRQILALVGLDFQQYTLYRPGSVDPLPLDSPVEMKRGEVFEAQRDGKYGAA